MSSPVRVTGVFVFVSILVLLSTVYVIFIDTIVSRTITNAGSQAVGAKVELGAAELSITEQRLALTQLTVANPSSPMHNIVQADNLVMDLDASALAWNKVVIDEVIVSNLRLNTQRTESGAIDNHWADTSNWNPLGDLTGFGDITVDSLPEPQQVIEDEGLQTPKAITEFKERLKTTEASLMADYEQLPTEQDIKQHQAKLKELLGSSSGKNKLLNLLGKGKELKELRKVVKADLEALKSFKNKVSEAQKTLGSDVEKLKQMPEQDWQRLKQKYALSGNGVNEIVSSLFGPQLGQWSQTAWNYYQMLAPYLDKYQASDSTQAVKESTQITERGRQILFEDSHPLPNYLIKKIAIKSELLKDGISIDGHVENLTTEPYRWNEPLKLDLKGVASFLNGFSIQGTLDHRDSNSSRDEIKLQATNIDLLKASASTDNFSIQSGTMDSQADITIEQAQLNANIELTFKQLNLTSQHTSEWQTQLLNGINQLQNFNLTIGLSGDLMTPEVTISSKDLKRLGTQIIQSMASDKIKNFETQLRTKILEQTSGPLAELGNLEQLSNIQEQLNLKELDLNNILKAGG